MNWVLFAAFIVASNAAKLDRTYLPPASAASAGGSPGSLLTPLAKSEEQSLPIGSFVNDHDGVVVDVAPVGTRASQSGLGGPRISYGSTDSKVGEAAFRETLQGPPKFGNNAPADLDSNPNLSDFHQSKPSRTSFQISRDNGARIIKYHNELESDRYSYGFEADNGIKAEERGVISNGVQAEGGFSYVGDDGKVYSVAYTADQNGYRPVGSHLPTPPPIPAEILRALEQNSRDEAAGLSEDGSYDAQKYNTGDYTKSDANGKYNDRQTIKFSIRPGSTSDTSATIDQNQGGFTKPNIFDSVKDTKDNSNVESSKNSPQIPGFGVNFINRNNFEQGQINSDAGIGSRKEFSQQKLQGSTNLGSSLINKDSSSSVISPKPLSQQDLQESINSGQDNLRPSSYDTSFSTVVSNNVPSKLKVHPNQEYVISSEEKNNQPIRFGQTFVKPTEAAFTQNFGIKNTGSELPATSMNVNKPYKDVNDSQNSFTTQAFHNQMTQNLNNRFSTSQSSTGTFNSVGLDQTKATNDRISGTSFSSARKPVLPTKQPERVLTTPFESFTTTNNAQFPTTFGKNEEQYTGSNFANFPGLTSTSKFTGIPFTQQEIHSKVTPQTQFNSMGYNDLKGTTSPFSFSSSSQNLHLLNQQYKPTENNLQTAPQFSSIRPNNNQLSQSLGQSTQYNEQSHGPDTSYFYNKPSMPIGMDSIHPGQKFSITSSDKFDSSLLSKQDTKFSEGNKNFISSTYSQDTSGLNKQTNSPPLAPFSQTTVSENKGSYQTNGITQASISPFPSIFSTSLNSNESGKNVFKPFQQNTQINSQSQTQFIEPSKVSSTGILQPSSTDLSNINGNSDSQTQQYDNKIYEYKKPPQSFSSASGNVANKQQGHPGTQFSVTTPFRENESITSDQNEETSFGMQIISKFGKPDKNLDKNITPFELKPSNQPFKDTLTTFSIQNPTDVTKTQSQDSGNTSQFEIYEYTKPLQSLTSTSSKEEINRNKNQETELREKFNKQSTTTYTGSQTESTDNFHKEAQLTTQFNQEEFERKTEIPEISQTASTFDSSIYQYTKPVQSFLTTSQQQHIPQRETSVGVMSTNFAQHFSGEQQFDIQSSQDRKDSEQTTLSQFTQGNQPSITLSTPFPGMSQQQLSNRFNSENQENIGEIYNYKKPNQNYSVMTKPLHEGQNPQFNSQFQTQKIQNQESGTASVPGMLTTLTNQNRPNSISISSNSEAENSYNSQERSQQNTQLGEIYEYSKPTETLTTPTHNNIRGQNKNQQLGQTLNQVNSEPNSFIQNLGGDISTTQNEPTSSPLMGTQTNSNTQDKFTKPDRILAQTSFSSGINSKPIRARPQFAFQSACCRGLQAQKPQEPQITQSTIQNKGSSDLKNNQNFESQKLTTQGFTGENFGGPRKPPSFDDKGYHY